jgi:hypothetical protein
MPANLGAVCSWRCLSNPHESINLACRPSHVGIRSVLQLSQARLDVLNLDGFSRVVKHSIWTVRLRRYGVIENMLPTAQLLLAVPKGLALCSKLHGSADLKLAALLIASLAAHGD